MFAQAFHVVLYQPIFNLFIELYNIVPGHDVGVVILIITLLIRLVLYPLTSSSIKAQQSLQGLQPKLDELKKKHAGDQQALAQATMEVYKNNKVNPFASCLPLLIQLPILIALYAVLRAGLASTNIAENLYSFVHDPGTINPVSLGLFNLQQPNYVLAILAGLAQYLQARGMTKRMSPKPKGEGGKDESMMLMMNKQMLYFMPAMTAIIGFSLPGGLALYWFFGTLLMALQQYVINRGKNVPPAETPQNPGPSEVIEGKIVS
jgi:YidC/Oxa1 family membrane protein insertase